MEGIKIKKNIIKFVMILFLLSLNIGCCWWDDDDDNPVYSVKNISADVSSEIEVQQGNKVVIKVAESENKIENITVLNGIVEKTGNSLEYYYTAPYIGNTDTLTVQYVDSGNIVKTTNYNVVLKNKVTFMVYISGENNLGLDWKGESYAVEDLKEIEKVSLKNNYMNINTIIYIDVPDKIGGNGCYIYTGNTADNLTINNTVLKGFKNTGYYGTGNTGALVELTNFINYTKENIQSEKYVLDLWSHGDGWKDDTYYRQICYDDGDRDSLNMREVENAILNSYIPKIDIIYTDACFMGGIEVAYQLRNVSDYLVFSPELTPGLGGDYTEIIKGINDSDFSAKTISEKMVKANGNYYKNFWNGYYSYPYVFSAVDQSKLNEVVNALKGVCEEIVKFENINVISKIKEFKSSTDVLCYDNEYRNINSEYVDIGDLFVNIQKILTTVNHTTALEGDIQTLLTAINSYVIYKEYGNGKKLINGNMITYRYEDGTSGLSIYLDFVNMTGVNEYAEYKTATSFGEFSWYQEFLNKLYGL